MYSFRSSFWYNFFWYAIYLLSHINGMQEKFKMLTYH